MKWIDRSWNSYLSVSRSVRRQLISCLDGGTAGAVVQVEVIKRGEIPRG